MQVLDLFCGAGGMSLGFKQAGYQVRGIDSWSDACQTYRDSLKSPCMLKHIKPEDNALEFLPRTWSFDVLVGSPPCQPYSRTGSQQYHLDSRDMVPWFIQAVRDTVPKAFVMENVHCKALSKLVDSIAISDYQTRSVVLNSVDYGVPQKRIRNFWIGTRYGALNDVVQAIEASKQKHVSVIDILGSSAFTSVNHSELWLDERWEQRRHKYEVRYQCARPRDLRPSEASRTLTCRNLCGKTNDAIRILMPNGLRRMLQVHEAAMLQGFPPEYFLPSLAYSKNMTLIGNAVPPPVSKTIALALLSILPK